MSCATEEALTVSFALSALTSRLPPCPNLDPDPGPARRQRDPHPTLVLQEQSTFQECRQQSPACTTAGTVSRQVSTFALAAQTPLLAAVSPGQSLPRESVLTVVHGSQLIQIAAETLMFSPRLLPPTVCL